MQTWKDYTQNGVKFTMLLNTKRHVWLIFFDGVSEGGKMKPPDMEFTKAKGEAIIKFLQELTRVENERV